VRAVRWGGGRPWFKGPAAVVAGLCLALAGCGDGDSSDLRVVVKVNGQQVAGPLGRGADEAVIVASGDEVVVESEAGASFSVEPSQVEVTEAAGDDTGYQFVPLSVSGGAATIKVASRADAADRLSVVLTVQSHRFDNRTWTVGETVVDETTYQFDGSTRRYEHQVESVDATSYTMLTEPYADYSIRDTYDLAGNHTYRRSDWWTGEYWDAEWCQETPGELTKAFPLYVGKEWDTRWEFECVFDDARKYGAHNQVVGVETVAVPAGAFLALHIVSEYTSYGWAGGADDPHPAGTTDCWWSVDFQQDVLCIRSSVDGAEQSRVEAVQLAGQGLAARKAASAAPGRARLKPAYRPS
jgi:hypothetical protein